jgi:hypothetical protein
MGLITDMKRIVAERDELLREIELFKSLQVPLGLLCPSCGAVHIDEGEWAVKIHHKHLCAGCGNIWEPFGKLATFGVDVHLGCKVQIDQLNSDLRSYEEGDTWHYIEENRTLRGRIGELLELVAKLTQETPYSEELDECRSVRSALIAEVGTLRSEVRMLQNVISELSNPVTIRDPLNK